MDTIDIDSVKKTIAEFAEIIGVSDLEMGDNARCALTIGDRFHLEMEAAKEHPSLLIFCSCGQIDTSEEDVARRCIDKNLAFANSLGVFLAVDPRDKALLVTTLLPIAALDAKLLGDTVDRVIGAADIALEEINSDTGSSGSDSSQDSGIGVNLV